MQDKDSPGMLEKVKRGIMTAFESGSAAKKSQISGVNLPARLARCDTAYSSLTALFKSKLYMLGDAERSLLDACDRGRSRVRDALAERDFSGAISALAELKAPIDRFFDDVLVMDEDTAVRENRLRLLNRFVEVFVGVADVGALSRKK